MTSPSRQSVLEKNLRVSGEVVIPGDPRSAAKALSELLACPACAESGRTCGREYHVLPVRTASGGYSFSCSSCAFVIAVLVRDFGKKTCSVVVNTKIKEIPENE